MKTVITSFSGGEMSPEMFGHVDDAKLRTGLRTMRNFVARPSGAAVRRPGTRFVNEVKDSTKRVNLIPFRFSIDQTLAIQVGEGYFRFHTDGATVLFATERRISSVNTSTDTITFTAAHGFASNDQIRLFSNGGTLMAGLTGGTTYYVIPVDSTSIKVSASPGPGAAVNITGSGSGVQSAWLNSDTPPLYIGSKNVTAAIVVTSVNTVTGEMTASSAHYLTTGDPIVAPSTAVGGLSTGTTYYAISTASDKFKVALSYADAIGNIPIAPLAATTGTMAYVNKIACGIGHGLSTGDPINFTVSGGTIIGGLTAGTTYYAIVPNNTSFYLATTEANALAGTKASIITSTGTGTTKFHYVYEAGDLVTNINSPQGFYHCRRRNPQDNTPGGAPTYWYQMPWTGEFELPNDYLESEVMDLDYAQSNDVLRLAHPSHPAIDLRRLGATSWSITEVATAPRLSAPTNASGSATIGQGLGIDNITTSATPALFTVPTAHAFQAAIDTVYLFGCGTVPDGVYVVNTVPSSNTFTLRHMDTGFTVDTGPTPYVAYAGKVQLSVLSSVGSQSYKVTASDENGNDSLPSSVVTVTNNLNAPGSYNTISWTAVTGAVRYNVFRELSGIYYYIGSTETTSFKDDNIDEDASVTIPYQDSTLDDNNPGAVGFYNQRSIFAGFTSYPQDVLTSRTGGYEDISYHLPLLDTDRIYVRLTATSLCRVQYVVPMQQLLVLTDSTEFRIVPLNSEVLTPTSAGTIPFSYVGCAKVKPQVVNGAVVFAGARGGHVYEAGFANEAGGFVTGDMCLRSAHLFDGLTITSATQQKAPLPVLWFVSSNGKLLGCTYVPGEGVGAWHQHDTDGLFEAVCAVAEGNEDAVYVVVKRTIDGSSVRYVERIEPFAVASREDSFFVDCGLTYDGASTTTITGLDHLEGETVAVLADGKVQTSKVVTGGEIDLDRPAELVHVGLPMTSDLETPPWAAQIEAAGQGRSKNVAAAFVRVKDSGPFYVGPDEDHLSSINPTRSLTTGEFNALSVGKWNQDGGLFLRVTDPLPCTVVGITLRVAIGD